MHDDDPGLPGQGGASATMSATSSLPCGMSENVSTSRKVTPASKSSPAAVVGSNRRIKSAKRACSTCFINWS